MAGKKSVDSHASQRESGRAAVHRWKKQDQLEFDIEFYDQVLLRNPDQVEVLRVQGELLSRRGHHRRALKVDQRLVELRPEDGVAHYNLACSLAVLGFADEALAELWHAFDVGYDDVLHLESDPDLEPLRHLPGYAELLRVYGDEIDDELDDERFDVDHDADEFDDDMCGDDLCDGELDDFCGDELADEDDDIF